ncbi:MAG: HD domain-containing protein [Sulfurimonas sp.]|uniref:HD domain-containing phosphohydrolase n=1 Tax=Sulfurimonas sp. TaxID=2022749 RepID=UPI00263171F6|nr:HD domain-containing phosphohydrolase [Sulfurimonas sp.]MDD5399997.1 HD domain-containing protein [Sulfurimonas sp.]
MIIEIGKNHLKNEILEFFDANTKQIEALVFTIEIRDAYTQGHSKRVARYAAHLAKWMQMDEYFIKAIYVVGMLHDLGKIGIPDEILLKPSALTEIEYNLIKLHSTLSERIIQKLELFPELLLAVRHHHENFNGSGYPDGLIEENIPLMSRMICIVDVFDALTTRRVYRDLMSMEMAMEVMEEEFKKGKFDPKIYAIFKKNISKVGVLDLGHLLEFNYPELEERRNTFYFKNPITNLLNKTALLTFLSKGANKNESAFLAEINISGFSEYNRTYGLCRGDELLKKIGNLLTRKFGNSQEFEMPLKHKIYIFHGYADKFYLLEFGFRDAYLKARLDKVIKKAQEEINTPLYYKVLLHGEKIPSNIHNKVGYLL